jgi:2-dehydro-3-deoxyphosphogluconate aldolase/(4S)-4-hydroxy-2-oxoglutarate aldolase
MNKSESYSAFGTRGIIPVVRASSAAEAVEIVEAIKAGGLSLLEITMTVPGAVQVIEELAGRFEGEAIVGAGTVLDAEKRSPVYRGWCAICRESGT